MAYTEYFTPTHVYFGKETERLAGKVLRENGAKKVLLHYGSSSAEKSGLLGVIRTSLRESGIDFVELGGVKPNPRLTLARKGIEICRSQKVDFILAVGGGSVLDSAKCIAYGTPYDGDVWDFYCGKKVPEKRMPMGCVLTLSATGSEMSNSSVITNDEVTPNDKFGCNTNLGRPVFALMNPELTYSV
ncbi:MAG: iron-containing alcohol dehydrogenase, partial [Spirochaetales bacterium]|nr:iron-containing alcohol dehydrogenase [Spirochaetales bacterium]